MNKKMNAGIVVAAIAAISTFGVIDSLQAAPKESQRLRGMDGRAFLVDQVPASGLGPYCYYFNADGEWIDARWPGLEPGGWEQHSTGAKTPYSAWAEEELDVGGGVITLVVLEQEGVVTPARGKGVLQLEAVTEIYVPAAGPDPVAIIKTAGYEIDADDCPPPFPAGT